MTPRVSSLFKVHEVLNGRSCRVLLDCGANSNFLSRRLARQMQLDTGEACGMVALADGHESTTPATRSKALQLRMGPLLRGWR